MTRLASCTRCAGPVVLVDHRYDLPYVQLDEGDPDAPAVTYVLCVDCVRAVRAFVVGMDR